MSVASTGSRRWQDTVRFADLLLRAAERDPDHEAVVFPDARVTYGALEQRAFEVARALLALGIGPAEPGRHLDAELHRVRRAAVRDLARRRRDGADQRPLRAARARLRDRERRSRAGVHAATSWSSTSITSRACTRRCPHYASFRPERDSRPARGPQPAQHRPARRTRGGGDGHARSVRRFRERGGRRRRPDAPPSHVGPRRRVDDVHVGHDGDAEGLLLSHEALVRTAVVAGRTRFRITPEDRFWDPLPMFHMSAILRSSASSTAAAPSCR